MAIINAGGADFDQLVAQGRVIVDFWATWCGPCQMQGGILERELAPAHPEVSIVKVDVDKEPNLAVRFGVMSIPTLLVYRDGKLVRQFTGVTTADELLAALRG